MAIDRETFDRATEEELAGRSNPERVTARLNERLGTEDRETWREHAPDEPHPSEREEAS